MAQAEIARGNAKIVFEAYGEKIKLDPHRPGRDRARLDGHEVPVWALIGHLKGISWDVVQTALDYDLPVSAVQAALAYYRSDPRFIDAFLLLNDEAFAAFGQD